MSEIQKINSCPEFPFFGAHYPDATCIDGSLWDLDKCDVDGMLYGGGEIPCPFCSPEDWKEYNYYDQTPEENGKTFGAAKRKI
jgi:hypothetical protein